MLVTVSAFFPPTSPIVMGAYFGAATGAISAATSGGDIGRGMLVGTAIGTITGAATGGFVEGALAPGSVFAKGGFTLAERAFITGTEFGLTGFGTGVITGYAGGARSFSEALKWGLVGAGYGFATGALVGALGIPGLHGANFSDPAKSNSTLPCFLGTAQVITLATPIPGDELVVLALAVGFGIYQASRFPPPGTSANPLPLKGAPGPDYFETPQGNNQPPRPGREGWWIFYKILEAISEMVDHFTQ